MKRVCTPVAMHRRWLSKGVTGTVSWLSQSTDIFTKFNEVNLQLQWNDGNLIKAKSAISTFLSKFNTLTSGSSQAVRKKTAGSHVVCVGISQLLYGLRT